MGQGIAISYLSCCLGNGRQHVGCQCSFCLGVGQSQGCARRRRSTCAAQAHCHACASVRQLRQRKRKQTCTCARLGRQCQSARCTAACTAVRGAAQCARRSPSRRLTRRQARVPRRRVRQPHQRLAARLVAQRCPSGVRHSTTQLGLERRGGRGTLAWSRLTRATASSKPCTRRSTRVGHGCFTARCTAAAPQSTAQCASPLARPRSRSLASAWQSTARQPTASLRRWLLASSTTQTSSWSTAQAAHPLARWIDQLRRPRRPARSSAGSTPTTACCSTSSSTSS